MKLVYGFILAIAVVCVIPAKATTLQDFEAKTPAEQGRFVSDYVDKMATDISVKNPHLGRAIVEYFANTPAGKHAPDGVIDLTVQEMTVDTLARQGKADKSKIQIEAMIIYVVKQKFSTTTTPQR